MISCQWAPPFPNPGRSQFSINNHSYTCNHHHSLSRLLDIHRPHPRSCCRDPRLALLPHPTSLVTRCNYLRKIVLAKFPILFPDTTLHPCLVQSGLMSCIPALFRYAGRLIHATMLQTNGNGCSSMPCGGRDVMTGMQVTK